MKKEELNMDKKEFEVLIAFCIFSILMFNFVNAGSASFNIANKTLPSQSYFFVNGTSGNVGIGTTTPVAKLEVNGLGNTYGINVTGANTGVFGQGSTYGVYGYGGIMEYIQKEI